eukprot:TRINITY_DN941_c0_g1_i2.p2 TRINITY_DN941_c0_g1~~TRINITY_DN941_c0_g1_i2.p2  ORF type:complete len:203 (-),score=-7.30 TRINITY_DN941_c0_g1_i2:894-1502(-)
MPKRVWTLNLYGLSKHIVCRQYACEGSVRAFTKSTKDCVWLFDHKSVNILCLIMRISFGAYGLRIQHEGNNFLLTNYCHIFHALLNTQIVFIQALQYVSNTTFYPLQCMYNTITSYVQLQRQYYVSPVKESIVFGSRSFRECAYILSNIFVNLLRRECICEVCVFKIPTLLYICKTVKIFVCICIQDQFFCSMQSQSSILLV